MNKTKTKQIIIVIVMVLLSSFINAENKTKGTLHFYDGSTKDFHNLIHIYGQSYANNKKDWSKYWKYGTNIYVLYNNSEREMPFAKISSIEIKNWKYTNQAIESKVEFITTTGVTFENDCQLYSLKVDILDELTGEVKEQSFNFYFNEKLNIKKIILTKKEK